MSATTMLTTEQRSSSAQGLSRADRRKASRRAQKLAEERQYRMILVFSLIFFLAFVLLMRLLPRGMRPAELRQGEQRSILAEARAMAHTTIPFAFMG